MKFLLTCIMMIIAIIFVMACLYKHDDNETIIELDDTVELSDEECDRLCDELIKRQDKDINLDKEE